ncbi:unnamed protein product [Spirodela intermedia]|uniref:L-gulonolactone oxidase n=1 Tax=Spirodela intermedia TaxID=51605 RepID=A0A7I8JCX8_SPIIN|nr:unnamed protein product [Spirodela intermedia]CAA6667373.1 unnamed protein product [Spirodela intermedia]
MKAAEVSMGSALLVLLTTLLLCREARASPPASVVKCSSGNKNCTVSNSYGAFPTGASAGELFLAVSNASIKKQHMKVVTVYSHSIPKLSCPGGPAGAGLVISTERLNKVVSVDLSTNQMTFQAGITLRQLLDAAAARGLALPYTPYWQGVTLGGMLGTGSHGSSLFGKGSAVHERVVGLRLIIPTSDPINGLYAKAIDLVEGDEDLLAAKVSLGVLGVVSQVTLQLEPMFKRSITNRVQKDVGFEHNIPTFAASTEFGDIIWYPAQSKVVYRDDIRLPVSIPGKAKNDFTGFQPQISLVVAGIRGTEELLELTDNSDGKCLVSKLQVATLLETGSGLKNNDGSIIDFTGYPVIGNQSDMQTSGSCLFSKDDSLFTVCAWDPRISGLFYHQTTISIPVTEITSFIADVKKLRDLRPSALCGIELYYGFLMRFVRNSTAYLGKTSDSVDVDITYYRSRKPDTPRLDEDVLEEIEQLALFKYNGMPHWGKNRNVGFLTVRERLGEKGDKFVAAMAKYDKDGLFSSDWTDAILGLRGKSPVTTGKGCALEGLCICAFDEHCAPSKGYYCKPG